MCKYSCVLLSVASSSLCQGSHLDIWGHVDKTRKAAITSPMEVKMVAGQAFAALRHTRAPSSGRTGFIFLSVTYNPLGMITVTPGENLRSQKGHQTAQDLHTHPMLVQGPVLK